MRVDRPRRVGHLRHERWSSNTLHTMKYCWWNPLPLALFKSPADLSFCLAFLIISCHFSSFSLSHFPLSRMSYDTVITVQCDCNVTTISFSNWLSSSKRAQISIMKTKEEIITEIRSSTGMLKDSPTPNGGNTNTGPLAKRFLDPKKQGWNLFP